jgi:superfamily II DNA or RNA helicase
MITISLNKAKTKLQIKCEDLNFFTTLREHFSVANNNASFVRNKFKGRRVFIADRKYAITPTGQCEIGMLHEIRNYIISQQKANVVVEANVMEMFDSGWQHDTNVKLTKDLRYYQQEVVDVALKTGCGTCVLGTGAGKTLTTAALIENYYKYCANKNTFKCLIIVPDLGLVSQTYGDFVEYGVSFTFTKWTGKNEPDLCANVVICNMGILRSRFEENDWIKYVDVLVIDEAHKLKSDNKISKVLADIKTRKRFGFTGTLPVDKHDMWFIIGKLGPVLYEKNSSDLRSENFLTNVEVKVLELQYNNPIIPKLTKNHYRNELDFIYNNRIRNLFITKLSGKVNNNTLVLVNHIIHGEQLFEIMSSTLNKQVFFIRGEVDVEERDKIKNIMETNNDVVCIAISAIFSTGVNIKNIHNIMFIAGGKSFIRTVQSIGRGLRLHDNKTQLTIYDICDNLKYSKQHNDKRKEIYNKEKINFIEKEVFLS